MFIIKTDGYVWIVSSTGIKINLSNGPLRMKSLCLLTNLSKEFKRITLQ